MAGRVFDKYEIVERIAIGGMGEVFYALHHGRVKGFERPVILKNLLPDLAMQPGFVEQFLDEARVAATLNHPNVVSIYEVGLWDGSYYIAMEFIRGRNLAQLLRLAHEQKLPMPPHVAARIVHDAALGLDHAHRARDMSGRLLNIVHRDVSPHNLMVRDDGVTKVVDFGIARGANRTSQTQTGMVKGKLAYMPPEQLRGENVDGRADQYSLGVVLWELCAQRRLFYSDREGDVMSQVMGGRILAPSTERRGLPAALDELTMQMLERDRERRLESCAQVAERLETYLATVTPPCTQATVAEYVKSLGVRDLYQKPATPGERNFVISLAGANEREVATLVKPTGSSRRGAAVVGLVLFGGLLAAVAAGIVASGVLGGAPPERPPVAGAADAGAPTVVGLADSGSPLPVVDVVVDAGLEPPRKRRVVVTSEPSGAQLTIRGKQLGLTPAAAELTCKGQVELVLAKPGFANLRYVAKGCGDVPALVLSPLGPGKLSVTVQPAGGRYLISVEGTALKKEAPAYFDPIAPGTYTVRVRDVTSGQDARQSVEVEPGKLAVLTFKMQ